MDMWHPFMNEAAQIDRLRSMRIDPVFHRLSGSNEEACFECSCAEFVHWIDTHPKWTEAFYANLQSLEVRSTGEPLLTTWLSGRKLRALLEEGRGVPVFDQILMRVQCWAMLDHDEVLFDFYVDGPKP